MGGSKPQRGTLVAGALGECVHVTGVVNFLRLAESIGWHTIFLGPAVSIRNFLEAAKSHHADLVGVSYRLTPETGERLLGTFCEAADEMRNEGTRFIFGGTPPVAERAAKIGFFERVFDGTATTESIIAFLKNGSEPQASEEHFPQTMVERARWKAPYPLLRHHFGLPTLEATLQGVELIAESGLLDVISLGTDQDAQEHFFHPDRQKPHSRGAGGVPVRSADDLCLLFLASRRGNFPLMRTYSGTDDFIALAEMFVETINIAWCAIPIFWFNQMDGRGPWDLEGSIREHQRVMAWYGELDIPVEVNDPHHWALRGAPDVITVASAYLSAYNARAFGARDYVAQMMFNSPPGLSDAMDLAKMIACLRVTKPLAGADFRIWRQTRTGLLSYPVQQDAARAHLASSVYLQMALKPNIVHVVGHTEAHHAASADDVIEACGLARRAIENALRGAPDPTADPAVEERAAELTDQVSHTLKAIGACASAGVEDPLTDPPTLARAVRRGILDAPHLVSNRYALGQVTSHIDSRGACVAVDPISREILGEQERIAALKF